jgi:hypothetical protein
VSRVWDISVFDGLKTVFHAEVPLHEMSEAAVKECLRTLIAKSLSEAEIVDCHLNGRWGSKKRLAHLDVERSMGDGVRYRYAWTCGGNPHAIAYPRAVA